MVKTASPNITQSDIDFSALLEILQSDDTGEGLRAEEIAEQWGVCVQIARKQLRRAMDMEIVRRSSRRYQRLDGHYIRVPTYVMEVRQ